MTIAVTITNRSFTFTKVGHLRVLLATLMLIARMEQNDIDITCM